MQRKKLRQEVLVQNRLVKELVSLQNILNDQSIADILLVRSWFKPSALVEVSYLPHRQYSRSQFLTAVRHLEKILQKLGLFYKLHLNYPKNQNNLTQFSYIALDPKMLKKLIKADERRDTKKRRMEVGKLLGYPKTAVVAFANGKVFARSKLPKAILKTSTIKFLNFQLSRNWKRELKYVRRRAQEIEKISPVLFRRIVSN